MIRPDVPVGVVRGLDVPVEVDEDGLVRAGEKHLGRFGHAKFEAARLAGIKGIS